MEMLGAIGSIILAWVVISALIPNRDVNQIHHG